MNKIVSIFAPGRFNIIGEHTDHQGGLVLPGCIQQGITLHGLRTENTEIAVHSVTYGGTDVFNSCDFDLSDGWKRYVRGVVKQFKTIYRQPIGARIWIESNLPSGGGLSSSAALEIGLFYLLEKLFGTAMKPFEMIKAAHYVENTYVGVNCGIMDQTIVYLGKEDHALQLDCSDLTHHYTPIHPDLTFVLVNTGVERTLSSSQYNTRVEELQLALDTLQNTEQYQHISQLSNLGVSDLDPLEKILGMPEFKRVRHVLTENQRVRDYSELMRQDLIKDAGAKLFESHYSLRDDFEASWELADTLVDLIRDEISDLVMGARMVGAGWGGSILAQLAKSNLETFSLKFNELTSKHLSRTFDLLEVSVAEGVRELGNATHKSQIQSFLLDQYPQ